MNNNLKTIGFFLGSGFITGVVMSSIKIYMTTGYFGGFFILNLLQYSGNFLKILV